MSSVAPFGRVARRIDRLTVDRQKSLLPALWRDSVGAVLRSAAVRRSLSRLLPPRRHDPLSVIFLCGCYNSGTTIMREILGSHRMISSMPREGVVFSERLTAYSDGRWTRFWPAVEEVLASNERDFETLTAAELLDDWRYWVRPGSFLLEKSITNSARMVELQGLFPDAKFIVMRRQVTGVAEGIVRRTRPLAADSGARPLLEDAVEQWRLSNTLIDRQLPSLKHVLEVRYEALVSDPATELERVFRFLDLPARISRRSNGVEVDELVWRIFDGDAVSRLNLGAGEARSDG